MSVQGIVDKIQATLTSSNQVIALTGMYFQLDADISVVSVDSSGIATVRTLATDYTLSGAGDFTNYGSLTVVGGTVGHTWYIYRNVPMTQLVAWVEAGNFSTLNMQTATDKLTIICQQLYELIKRCLKYPVQEPVDTNGEAPAKSGKGAPWHLVSWSWPR